MNVDVDKIQNTHFACGGGIQDDKNVIKLDTLRKLPEKTTPRFMSNVQKSTLYVVYMAKDTGRIQRKYPSENRAATEGGEGKRWRMKTFITHVKWRNDCQAKARKWQFELRIIRL